MAPQVKAQGNRGFPSLVPAPGISRTLTIFHAAGLRLASAQACPHPDLNFAGESWVANLYYSLGYGMRWLYDRRIATPPTLDTERYFPNARRFVAAWEALRDEALAVG